jgi:hypothetical protein
MGVASGGWEAGEAGEQAAITRASRVPKTKSETVRDFMRILLNWFDI